jgi:hypothetical protein
MSKLHLACFFLDNIICVVPYFMSLVFGSSWYILWKRVCGFHNILGLWNPHIFFPSIVAIISLSLFIDKDMELLLKLNPNR